MSEPIDLRVPRGGQILPMEFAADHLNFYDGEAIYRESIRPLTTGQLAVLACDWYLSEVNNGGHDQFFWNSTGMVWADALAGFQLLGAPEHHAILTQAVSLFPGSRPSFDRETRQKELENINKKTLNKLDNKVYDCPEDLEALIDEYIESHPEEFFI